MSKDRTLDEWRKIYEAKTGDKPKDVVDEYNLLYLSNRGYALVKDDKEGKMIFVAEACGDGKFWHDLAELIATSLNYHYVGTIITRDIKAYIKAFGWTVERAYHYISPSTKEIEDRYLMRDKQGRPLTVTYAGVDKQSGNKRYWGIHYIDTFDAPDLHVADGAIEVTEEFIERSNVTDEA